MRWASSSFASLSRRLRNINREVRATDSRRPISWKSRSSSVAVEDRKHFVEHVAHHLLEVIRALNRPVDPIHALEEPKMGVAFLLSPFPLGDVDHHPTQLRCEISLHDHGYEVT